MLKSGFAIASDVTTYGSNNGKIVSIRKSLPISNATPVRLFIYIFAFIDKYRLLKLSTLESKFWSSE